MLRENDNLRRDFDAVNATAVESIDCDFQRQQATRQFETPDEVENDNKERWQARAEAAEQVIKETQDSMVSRYLLPTLEYLQLIHRCSQKINNFVLVLIDGNAHTVSLLSQSLLNAIYYHLLVY